MNKHSNDVPYEILLAQYQEAQREIQYLEYKVATLHKEVDVWQKAYEEFADILIEHGLM